MNASGSDNRVRRNNNINTPLIPRQTKAAGSGGRASNDVIQITVRGIVLVQSISGVASAMPTYEHS
jgi:hypothetical protein